MNKLGYLRKIVDKIEYIQLPNIPVSNDWLHRLPYIRINFSADTAIGIRNEAGGNINNLVDFIYKSSDEYQRGVNYKEMLEELCSMLMANYVGRKANSITDLDLELLEDKLYSWFRSKAVQHTMYVPCLLSVYPGTSFLIGEIKFIYIDDFINQMLIDIDEISKITLNHYVDSIKGEGAAWIAVVNIDNCLTNRASELAELAVDIALAGLQCIFPLHFAERLARITARTLPLRVVSMWRETGQIRGGVTNQHPTLGMGPGCIEEFVTQGAAVLESVGNRLRNFLGTRKLLPKLEQAWCDAAYWYHEGLAEPLDTIAVPKLETAIEILFQATSLSKCRALLLKAIEIFHGLKSDQVIDMDTQSTVKTLVEKLVSDRSRILHGTWSTLNTDLRVSRENLTHLVQSLLVNYTTELDIFSSNQCAPDNVNKFLDSIQPKSA